jgi:hypothetical protein
MSLAERDWLLVAHCMLNLLEEDALLAPCSDERAAQFGARGG